MLFLFALIKIAACASGDAYETLILILKFWHLRFIYPAYIFIVQKLKDIGKINIETSLKFKILTTTPHNNRASVR